MPVIEFPDIGEKVEVLDDYTEKDIEDIYHSLTHQFVPAMGDRKRAEEVPESPSLSAQAVPPGTPRNVAVKEPFQKSIFEVQPNFQKEEVEKARSRFIQQWEHQVAVEGPADLSIPPTPLGQALSAPLVELPRASAEDMPEGVLFPGDKKVAQVSAGVVNAAASFIEFFGSPVGIATLGMGSAPRAAQDAVALYFASEMTKQLPAIKDEFVKSWKAGDVEKATEYAVSGLLNLHFAQKSLGHGLGWAPESAPVRRELDKTSPMTAAVTESGTAADILPPELSSSHQKLVDASTAVRQNAADAMERANDAIDSIGIRMESASLAPQTQAAAAMEVGKASPETASANMQADVQARLARARSLARMVEGASPEVAPAVRSDLARTLEDLSGIPYLNPSKPKEPTPEEAPAATGKTETVGEAPATREQPPAPLTEKVAEQPQAPSVGAAAKEGSGEFNQPTSLKNASGDLDRLLNNFPEATPTERQAMIPAMERANETLGRDALAGEKLADEVIRDPRRRLTGDDSALLLKHKMDLLQLKNQAASDTFNSDPVIKKAAQKRFDEYSEKLLNLLDALKVGGAHTGRELRWRQALLFEDYSFETMLRDKGKAIDRDLKPGDAEWEQVKKLNERIADLEKQLKEKESKKAAEDRESEADDAFADIADKTETTRKRTRKEGVERDIDQERKDVIDNLKERFTEEGDLTGSNASIRKLMEILYEDGYRERVPMEQKLHEILTKEVDPTITLEETQDLMSGYGKFKELSKEPTKVGVRGIVGEIQQVRKLLDFWKGKAPAKTGMERRQATQAERDYQKVVNEAKKRFGTISEDPAKALKSALDAIETRLKNRLADLKQEVATRQKIVKERAPTPYNEETLRLRKEIEEVKKEWDEIFGKTELTDAQKLERAEKSAARREEELKRQLRTGEIFPKTKITTEQRSAILDATNARIKALQEERQWAREAAQPKPEVADAEAARRSSALDKQIAAIEKQLADEAPFSKDKQLKPEETAANQARLDKLKALKEERANMRERLQPTEEPHVRVLRQILDRLRKQEIQYKEKLAKGDFSRRVKKEQPSSPEILEARVKVAEAKHEFLKGLDADRRARWDKWEKLSDASRQAAGGFVNVVSSFDFSAPRQALFAILTNVGRLASRHPGRAAAMLKRPFGEMFRAAWNESTAKRIEQSIWDRPNYKNGLDKAAGVSYTELDAVRFTKYEENMHSIIDKWAKLPYKTENRTKTVVTAPGKAFVKAVRGSNRAFITFLNRTRADLFDELLRANFSDRVPTKRELEAVGELVNISTGRGSLNPKMASAASHVLWAPKLLMSRIQTLTGTPIIKAGHQWAVSKDPAVMKMVVKEYARAVASAYILGTVAHLFSDEGEKEMTSSDYWKVIRGNTRIDLAGGFQQPVVLFMRLTRLETTTIKGKTKSIGIDRDIMTDNGWVVAMNFLRSKLRPDLGSIISAVLGEDFTGREFGIADAVEGTIVPLPFRGIGELLDDRGFSEAMILEAIQQFGAGVSTYEEQPRKAHHR